MKATVVQVPLMESIDMPLVAVRIRERGMNASASAPAKQATRRPGY
jgi:hypothetical protein